MALEMFVKSNNQCHTRSSLLTVKVFFLQVIHLAPILFIHA